MFLMYVVVAIFLSYLFARIFFVLLLIYTVYIYIYIYNFFITQRLFPWLNTLINMYKSIYK